MTPLDQCLSELLALAGANDAHAAELAAGAVDRLLVALAAPPEEAVMALGTLQARFMATGDGLSKIRADILDVIGERVTELLEGTGEV